MITPLNLRKIPTFYFKRIHVPSGHEYVQLFDVKKGVYDADLRHVPSATQSQFMDAMIGRWNNEQPKEWRYERMDMHAAVEYFYQTKLGEKDEQN